MSAIDLALAQLDLLARGGAVALLALWSTVLLRDARDALPARLAVAMNLSIIIYLLAQPLRVLAPRSLPEMLFDMLSVLAAPLFWLFAYAWFTDARSIGWRRWLIVAAFVSIPATQIYLVTTSGYYSYMLWLSVRVGLFGFALAGIWQAWRGRADDLVDARRRMRLAIIWTIGLFVLWIAVVESPIIAPEWRRVVGALTQFAIAGATLLVTAGLYAFAQPGLFEPTRPTPESNGNGVTAAPSALAEALVRHITTNRPYRADGLTIAALAAQLNEQEYRLRRLINGELGYRNFTAFLNSYRLAEVRAALEDSTQREVPILTIALDAGFGSLGPFNRAFRDAHGVTPSAYRAQHLADSGIG